MAGAIDLNVMKHVVSAKRSSRSTDTMMPTKVIPTGIAVEDVARILAIGFFLIMYLYPGHGFIQHVEP